MLDLVVTFNLVMPFELFEEIERSGKPSAFVTQAIERKLRACADDRPQKKAGECNSVARTSVTSGARSEKRGRLGKRLDQRRSVRKS